MHFQTILHFFFSSIFLFEIGNCCRNYFEIILFIKKKMQRTLKRAGNAVSYQHRFLAREMVIHSEILVSCHTLLYTA